MDTLKHDEIRSAVRENYGKVAASGSGGCGCSSSSCCGTAGGTTTTNCCGTANDVTAADISLGLGYSAEDANAVPEETNMGLGCGNPQAIASLQAGETVLDLGCGGGFDSFLAVRAVGEQGYVIGIDITPEMVSKSRRNTKKTAFGNVEFRLGEIENLPVADGIVDVIISNCVINLSPEKELVFKEAFRVLKPGGRLVISDVVRTVEMPDAVKKDMAMYTGCMAGASSIPELESMLRRTGFENIRIRPKDQSRSFMVHPVKAVLSTAY